MTNSWDDMRRAKEESYFDKKNREALERMSSKKTDKPRLSPVTGEAMEQIVINGVVVDRCPTSGGVWLDAGELEQLMNVQKESATGESDNLLTQFLGGLMGGKKK